MNNSPDQKTANKNILLPLGVGCALVLCLALLAGGVAVAFGLVNGLPGGLKLIREGDETATAVVANTPVPLAPSTEATSLATNTATPVTPATATPKPTATPTEELPPEPEISRLVFAPQTTEDNTALDPAKTFAEGIMEVHAVFDYANISPGDMWERVWYLDGDEVLRVVDPWEAEDSGVFDYSLDGEGEPLPPGEWVLEIYVADNLLATDSFTITPAKVAAGSTPASKPTPKATAVTTAAVSATATLSAGPTPAPVTSGGVYQLIYSKWDGGFHNIYTADTNGRNEKFILSRGSGPSWSKGGSRIYFFGEEGINQQFREARLACEFNGISNGIVSLDLGAVPGDICAVKADAWPCDRRGPDGGGPVRDLCSANGITIQQNSDWKQGTARWAMVAPTDDWVAFDARIGSDYRIYFRDIRSYQNIPFELMGEQAGWSPDGQKLVYRSGRDNKTGIWISNRNDSGHTPLTAGGSDSFPAWSPDGRTIAFSRDEGGNVDIYAVNVDGTNLRRLTSAPGPDTLALFTPGNDIIFRSARSGSWGIWKMDAAGGNQTQIIANAGVGPDWTMSKMDVR